MKVLSVILVFGLFLILAGGTAISSDHNAKQRNADQVTTLDKIINEGRSYVYLNPELMDSVFESLQDDINRMVDAGVFSEEYGEHRLREESGKIASSAIEGIIVNNPRLTVAEADKGTFKKPEKPHEYTAKFYGTIERMPEKGPDGIWIVAGREVLISKDTLIEEKYGKAAVGAYVEVKGSSTGKAITAYEIEVKRDENYQPKASYNSKFYGTIERMPEKGPDGIWIVAGREILVTKDTLIEEKNSKAAVGAYVKVKGARAGKTITAYEIEVKGNIK
jgi:hypothetical protein